MHYGSWPVAFWGVLSTPDVVAFAVEPPAAADDHGLKVTPIALPDPPLLAASGCHGPYFLRNVVELQTEGGIVGIGETHGGESVTTALERARKVVVGQNAFAYRKFARELQSLGMWLLRGHRAGLPRRLAARHGPPALRAGRRPGARLRSSSRRIFSTATPPIIR